MRLLAMLLILGTSTGAVAAADDAAADDYEIQASSAPAHPVGQKLSKGSHIVLPEGATIRFIDRTKSGGAVTRQCRGKYEGPIENCKPSSKRLSPTSPGATRGSIGRK
ncbi:MAG: hypothetical protein J2P50_09555 [Hyphomicrobiaceae bacterium]|nr:hypothetical protein [Hyphomicrobiaceae bacterium]